MERSIRNVALIRITTLHNSFFVDLHWLKTPFCQRFIPLPFSGANQINTFIELIKYIIANCFCIEIFFHGIILIHKDDYFATG